VKRASKPNKKITAASQLLPVHGLLSNVFGFERVLAALCKCIADQLFCQRVAKILCGIFQRVDNNLLPREKGTEK
jgi:hypothetical protein